MTAPGLIISAPASGGGKTILTLGLLGALRAKNFSVAPFKNGPDYIDPGFHLAACGAPSFNLDNWAMSPADLANIIFAQGQAADISIVEGSMGLFDGASAMGASGTGATADLAALSGWPVILTLDVAGQAQSVGAVALGCAKFREDVAIAGVVLNKVASPRHEALAREGLARAGIHCLGALPRQADLALPSRHLGLVQAGECEALESFLDIAAKLAAKHLDLDAIVAAARPTRLKSERMTALKPPGQRIALASDAAFSFIYPHLLAGWRAAGAQVLPFSPLADEAPALDADICWLPGGYPELHAGKLAGALRFKEGLRKFAQSRPVHGECGGYMVLGAGLVNGVGERHEMVGLLGLSTSFAQKKLHLGYRRARLLAPIPPYGEGVVLRGHEFHYASVVEQRDAPLAQIFDADNQLTLDTGSRRENITGAFFHLLAREKSH